MTIKHIAIVAELDDSSIAQVVLSPEALQVIRLQLPLLSDGTIKISPTRLTGLRMAMSDSINQDNQIRNENT